MGATTPGKPVKGKPPEGKGEGGPKVTPAPLPPGSEGLIDRFPGKSTTGDKKKPDPSIFGTLIGGPRKPPVAAEPDIFGKLLGGIKKTDKFKNRGPGGLGGFPGDLPSRPTTGMQAPNYTPRSAYKDEMEAVLRESKGAQTDDVVNKIKEIEEREREKRAGRSPNRFPMGGNERDDSPFSQERFDSYRAGFRPRKKEAVFFGERKPSSESKRPTKGRMRKAGPNPSPEAKNKFEEMLAYMKSFQK